MSGEASRSSRWRGGAQGSSSTTPASPSVALAQQEEVCDPLRRERKRREGRKGSGPKR